MGFCLSNVFFAVSIVGLWGNHSRIDGGECRNEATPVGTTEENDKLPDAHRLMHSQEPAKMSCNAFGGTCRLQVAGYLVFFEATVFPPFCAVNEDLPWSESWYTSAVGTLRTSQACWISIGRSLRDVTESMISMPIFSLFFQTCLVFNPTTEAATQRP
jgi:hypothetical protein